MIIGDRLRTLREQKKLSQGDIEKRTGLLRCYISRVENGHTVPAVETRKNGACAGNSALPALLRRRRTTQAPRFSLRARRAKISPGVVPARMLAS